MFSEDRNVLTVHIHILIPFGNKTLRKKKCVFEDVAIKLSGRTISSQGQEKKKIAQKGKFQPMLQNHSSKEAVSGTT